MTIMIDRDTDFDNEAEIDPDFDDATLLDEDDLDLGGLMYGCSDSGYHKDDYVLFEDSYTVTRRCDSCGDSWAEDKED